MRARSRSGSQQIGFQLEQNVRVEARIETTLSSIDSIEETEKSVLEQLILGEVDFDLVRAVLDDKDFNSETHRLIFQAMKSLHGGRIPIDMVNLCEELDNVPRPNGEEWTSYIKNLPLIALPIDTNNLNFHLAKIKSASRTRSIAETAYRLYEAASQGDIERSIQLVEKVSGFQYSDTEAEIITLANRKTKPRTWLLEGAIPDKFPTIIYGAGGLGKSFLALHLGILACVGSQQFMGLKFPTEPRNTLIIDYELDDDEQTRRGRQISHGLHLDDIPENLSYFAPGKNLAKVLPTLRTIIKSKNIGFVILDSLGASGTDGESVESVVTLLTELKRLGVATLVLDHQSKVQMGEKYENKTPFGSVYKENLSRSVFQLSRVERKENRVTLKLKHTKTNFGGFLNDLIFDIAFEGDRVLFTESTVKSVEISEIEQIKEAIQVLENSGERANQKAIVVQLKGKIGRDRLTDLLNKHDGIDWDATPGEGKEKVYKFKTLKPGHIDNQGFRVSNTESEDYEIPEEFLDDNAYSEGN